MNLRRKKVKSNRVLILACFLMVTLLCLTFIVAAGLLGYQGKLAPGTKYFDFGRVRYAVPEHFPEFIGWPPSLMGVTPLGEDDGVLIFESINPEGTVAVMVVTYADAKRGYLLAVQASYMPEGSPAEKWTTDYYIETGLFKEYKQSFVMEKVSGLPNLVDWIEKMKINLEPKVLIKNPAVWRF